MATKADPLESKSACKHSIINLVGLKKRALRTRRATRRRGHGVLQFRQGDQEDGVQGFCLEPPLAAAAGYWICHR